MRENDLSMTQAWILKEEVWTSKKVLGEELTQLKSFKCSLEAEEELLEGSHLGGVTTLAQEWADTALDLEDSQEAAQGEEEEDTAIIPLISAETEHTLNFSN